MFVLANTVQTFGYVSAPIFGTALLVWLIAAAVLFVLGIVLMIEEGEHILWVFGILIACVGLTSAFSGVLEANKLVKELNLNKLGYTQVELSADEFTAKGPDGEYVRGVLQDVDNPDVEDSKYRLVYILKMN